MEVPGFDKVVQALKEDDEQRVNFLKACLLKLGLQVNQEQIAVPSLSRLHLSSFDPTDTSELYASWHDLISSEDGEEYIKDENDTFHLEKPSAWSFGSVAEALPSDETEPTDDSNDEDRIIDYNKVVKRLVVHDKDLPQSKETPYFNHQAFFSNLQHYESTATEGSGRFGKNLLYGEVVTSTNTLLEK